MCDTSTSNGKLALLERRAYHHGNLRDALLDAAEAVLAEGREPSLRELATAVGVTPNAPYRHFADKAALLGALSERGFARLEHALAGRALDEAFARYLAFAREHPATFRLMFPAAPGGGKGGDEGGPATRTLDVLTTAVARELPPGSPFVAARRGAAIAWATIHGYAALSLAGALGEGAEAAPETIAAIVRAGLRTARTNAPHRR